MLSYPHPCVFGLGLTLVRFTFNPRYKAWLANTFYDPIGHKARVKKGEAKNIKKGDRGKFAIFDLEADPAESSPLCMEPSSKLKLPKDYPLNQRDMQWVRQVRETVSHEGGKRGGRTGLGSGGLVEWWEGNGCAVLKRIATRASDAAKCDEGRESLLTLKASGIDPDATKNMPCGETPCFPCCDLSVYDCRCSKTTELATYGPVS